MNTQSKAQLLADVLLDPSKRVDDFVLHETATELLRLEKENKALRACALKYLDYLRIPDQEKALEADLKNPEMTK